MMKKEMIADASSMIIVELTDFVKSKNDDKIHLSHFLMLLLMLFSCQLWE